MRPPTFSEEKGIKAAVGDILDEHTVTLYEWLSLVSLASPRICEQDSVDPFLSRYSVPNGGNDPPRRLVKVTWNGLLPARFISDLWLKILCVITPFTTTVSHMLIRFLSISSVVRSSADNGWFGFSARGFNPGFLDGGQGHTILRLPRPISKGPGLTPAMHDGGADDSQIRDEYMVWEFNGA